MLALRTLVSDIGNEMALYKELKHVPADRTPQLPQRHVPGERSACG